MKFAGKGNKIFKKQYHKKNNIEKHETLMDKLESHLHYLHTEINSTVEKNQRHQ